jgi:FKBP-type peptidyl-prolyl cis-trans isomerase 2
MTGIKKGDKVTIEYIGTFEDGTVFDSSDNHNNPLEFVAGTGQLIKGIDNAVIGMQEGEEKEVKIPANEAYGPHKPELVKELPKKCFPENQEIGPGMIFMMKMQDGKEIPLRITKVTDDTVTVDLNPPLAGKTLLFKIKVLAIAS